MGFSTSIYIENLHEKDGTYYAMEDGEAFSGLIENYYKNNQIKHTGNLKSGKFEGKWTHFEENGQIWLIENFQNGKKNGAWNLSLRHCTAPI